MYATALYGHFRNKNALLRAARNEGFHRPYKEKLAVTGEMRADPLGYLRRGSYAYVRFALESPTLYRLMFTPPAQLGVGEDPWSNEVGRQILSLLLKGLRCSQRHGFLPGGDLKRYGFLFWSTVHGAVCLNLQNRALDETAKWDATRNAVDTLLEVVAATATTRRPSWP